ncbi:sterol regulatory element-binding ECM22 [Fusarium mexicanum]|uniref:Sterol regulatory element-binding ECM22 n=1 Tax=Fusarium mexicanum TaxID=751941 RepID=A0A8H5MZ42_9HYPO|nr:sterol regulatory element-binding ECM22 [Fusarium mexicanum]
MTPSLEHVFTMRMYTSPDKALVIPEAKGNNHRIVAFLTHGHIKGSGLEAELLPGGADWILRDPDTNTGHLDVRVQFLSKEGHGIYIHFNGVLQIDEKWMEVFTGGPKARTLEFGENEWLGSPIIETSHPDLKWVERSAFVSELRWFIDDDGSVAVENAVYKSRTLEYGSFTRAVGQAAPTAGPAGNDVTSSDRNGMADPEPLAPTGRRTCVYAPPKIPLRERRAQQKEARPWDQTPWELEQTPKEMVYLKKTTVPPRLSYLSHDTGFNKLAVAMPLKSHELFQYLFESSRTPKTTSKIPGTEYLARTIDNPCALRSAILMAGMHFSFQFGDLAIFESTFLYHKIEVMRIINRWIASGDYKLEAAIIREMATLAFTEACHGELVAAETHISGILALIETARPGKSDPTRSDCCSTDRELANRYFVMSYVYITGLKSLLSGICRTGGHGSSLGAVPSRNLLKLSHTWHMSEAMENLGFKLQAIRLFPFFFSPLPQGARLNNADGQVIINSLRDFTAAQDRMFKNTGIETADGKFEGFWRRGPASRVLGEFVTAHIDSISVPGKKEESPDTNLSSFVGPWCGLTVASIFYMQDVLGALEYVDKRIHKYAVTLLQHDVAKVLSSKDTPRNEAFMFWQTLVGLIACLRALKENEQDRGLLSARQFFEEALKQQATSIGIATWSQAKGTLRRVAWPMGTAGREFIEELWEKTVTGRV